MGMLPSAWNDTGKDLLWKLLGGGDDNDEEQKDEEQKEHKPILPPMGVTRLYASSWDDHCERQHVMTDDTTQDTEDGIALQKYSFLLVMQQGWDDLLIPLYDMMSHSNGRRYLNSQEVAKEQTDFILNREVYKGVTNILIFGDNFGCGSSR